MTIVYRGESKRFRANFTDTAGGYFDPSAATLNIYDTDGTLQETYALTDLTRVSEGVYYVDYVIPADAEYCRWFASWTGTNDAFIAQGSETVFVAPTWMSTEDEVRSYLAGIHVDRVSDDEVEMQIRESYMEVIRSSGTGATYNELAHAMLMRAVLGTYMAYAAEYERTAGQLPGPVLDQIDRYVKMTEDAYKVIKVTDGSPAGWIQLTTLRGNRIEDNN